MQKLAYLHHSILHTDCRTCLLKILFRLQVPNNFGSSGSATLNFCSEEGGVVFKNLLKLQQLKDQLLIEQKPELAKKPEPVKKNGPALQHCLLHTVSIFTNDLQYNNYEVGKVSLSLCVAVQPRVSTGGSSTSLRDRSPLVR